MYKAIRDLSVADLVQDFTETASPAVQVAVKATISSLLGNLPPTMGESSVVTNGKNLASLMFNMQMTGYMFRNAEYRRGMLKSIESSGEEEQQAGALPSVTGEVTVNLGGMETKV